MSAQIVIKCNHGCVGRHGVLWTNCWRNQGRLHRGGKTLRGLPQLGSRILPLKTNHSTSARGLIPWEGQKHGAKMATDLPTLSPLGEIQGCLGRRSRIGGCTQGTSLVIGVDDLLSPLQTGLCSIECWAAIELYGLREWRHQGRGLNHDLAGGDLQIGAMLKEAAAVADLGVQALGMRNDH